jgi:2-methylaconitate cis-trans-isomerase PrpF
MTTLRVRNINTNTIIEISAQTPNKQRQDEGDITMVAFGYRD